jgi:hypothetical protein
VPRSGTNSARYCWTNDVRALIFLVAQQQRVEYCGLLHKPLAPAGLSVVFVPFVLVVAS